MHTNATPERTRAQRLAALNHANEIRCYRAGVKMDLVNGRRSLFDLVDDPLMDSAKVVEFLRCIPKIGKVKANKLMQAAAMSPSKTFGGTTERQWDSLSRVLRGTPFTDHQLIVARNERLAA